MEATSACEHCPGNEHRDTIIDETLTTVLSTLDMKAVLDRSGALMRRYFGHTRISLNRICADDPSMAEQVLVDDPLHPDLIPGSRFPLEGTACGLAVRQRRVQLFENLDPQHPRVREEQTLGRLGYGTLASFPLTVGQDRVLGTLEIAHPPSCGLLGRCTLVAEKMAQLIAVALHNSMLMEEVQRLNRLLNRENAFLKDQLQQSRQEVEYVAESPAMREVLERVRMVAPSDSTVLIRGETGTGKEGLARLVHELSSRCQGPFVVVNLGAIPETLVESELFGHEKGAFTGAVRRRLGRFEQASMGTIFLDEVGDAPLPVQVKLLRALQERQIERVGGSGSVQVDVRVVAATNRPLEQMVREETFRADLYYRLNTFPLLLPPLRERPEDLRPLAEHLLDRHAQRMHRRPPRAPGAFWSALEAHDWPGNVRELENFLERALILSPGDQLTLQELPGVGPARSPGQAADPVACDEVEPFDQSVRGILQRALATCGDKIYGDDGAAARLGLRPTTLQGKLRKYGLR